jgi:hypothetical protein
MKTGVLAYGFGVGYETNGGMPEADVESMDNNIMYVPFLSSILMF